MRLICPNCGAQYEVDDRVIPENGRDVQCSNCGHTWYQRSANSNADEAIDDPVAETPEAAEPEADFASTIADAAEVSPDEADAPASIADDQAPPEADDNEPKAPETTAKPRGLDDDVAGILRQEAERETAERAGENIGVETQPDLGLSEAAEESDANIKKKMARLRGLDDDHGAAVAAAAVGRGPRKDLLPDIDELNSTLTASTEDAYDEDDEVSEETKRSSGFRRSFAITILIFTILVMVYVFAPQIAGKFPPAKDFLASYVDWVNALRDTVDGVMQKVVGRLTALVTQIGGDGSSG
jgi:predicted Zn finger-like uncharacterized protein